MIQNDGNFYKTGDIKSTAKGSGARANGGKVALSLVPFHLLAGAARVMMGGTLKYAPWNWAKGMPWSTAVDCAFRHFMAWWYFGEDTDPESGQHHLDHVLCNVLFLKHYTLAYKEGDDRPPEYAGFSEGLAEFKRMFDEVDYLKRNPAIAALLEARRASEQEKNNVAASS